MAKRKSSSFLPKFLQTSKNKKFLHSTLDQLLNSKSLEKVDGYVGRRFGPSYSITDPYVSTVGQFRTSYQLEPSITYKNTDNEIEFTVTYDDLINGIKENGGKADKHNRLFEQEYYNWDGFVDYDKLINFGQYYWLPSGPGTASISASEVPTTATYTITKASKSYSFSPTYGTAKNPTIYLSRGGSYTFNVDQTSKFFIQTELGTTGKSAISFNRSTREIYGVTNNGTNNGSITFNVPQSTDQEFFTKTVTSVGSADLRCTEYTFEQLDGASLATIVGAGGIDGQLYLENKTIIFDNATDQSGAWPTTYSDNDKFHIFRILVTGGTITLLPITPIAVNEKVQLQEGANFSTFEFYRTVDGTSLVEVPTITAPVSTLYYQDDTDSASYGIIKLLDETTKIVDVETDVIGKKHYTTPNGVAFTNGMHVQTDTTFAPIKYQNKTYIVDGVGEGITLVPKDEHSAYELASSETKDYYVSQRDSADNNAWARNNHWYHKDVITLIATFNNENPVVDQDKRASRPIVEYKRNLQMINSGSIGLDQVDLVDTSTTDALSTIQNGPNFYIDGVAVTDGMKIIFTNDNEVEVRNKIYTVDIVDFDNNSTVEVRLIPSTDNVVSGEQVVAKQGNDRKGNTYWFNGTNWTLGQQKTLVNQSPLFDIFDSFGNSYSNNANYLSTNFVGTKLFCYATGTGSNIDSELGFVLKYKNFNNIGDIVFDNKYSTETFSYTDNTGSKTSMISTGLVKVTKADKTVSYIDGWSKIDTPSTQYQVVTYVSNGTAEQFEIGVAPKDSDLPGIIVFKDSTEFKTGWEYKLVEQKHLIEFDTAPSKGTQITIKVLSDNQTTFGYYEIPSNLSNNAFNSNFTDITLGQMRNHVSEIIKTAKGFDGVYPGASNLRDLPETGKYAGNILHHSSGLIFPGMFLQENHLNISNSIKYAQDEYTKFKQKFIQAGETLDLDFEDIPADVDTILASINNTKSSTFPFYYSDMVAHGTNKKNYTYTVTDNKIKSYQMETIFNPTQNTSRSVLVYINDIQAVFGKDYTFNTTRPAIELVNEPAIGSTIKIVDYPNTQGNYIPPTPSKMGLYPKYEPSKYSDDSYATTTEVIQGHDGSITKSYGTIIDNLILELEKRIYNNIKATYKPNVFNIHEVIPGRWRDTKFTRTEHQAILSKHFLQWAIRNRIDWTTHDGYVRGDEFTWNYNKFTDHLSKELLPGGWRAIYKHYFDTDRPHTHPWEMIGFSIKPTWWEDIYGPGPYAKGNLVLWEDLSEGKVYDPTTQTYTVNPLYIRKDLLQMIPSDDNGNLRSPFASLATGSTVYELNDKWAVGDGGPPQASWEKSSEYPFTLQIANAVMNPAKYFSLMYDTDVVYRTSLTNNIVSVNTNKQLTRADYKTPLVDQNIINGYSFYVANHLQFLGMAPSILQDIINKVDIKLATKLSGYTDKKFLKVLAEQVSPNAISENVMIPDEDYDLVVTKTSPIVSAPYSGVIVQETDSGYALYGYDVTNPFFNVIPSIQTRRQTVHEVLDIRFVEYLDADDQVLTIPYGTELSTPQQVFDFLIGYGRYLTSLGFDFDNSSEEIANGVEVANWAMAGKEFGYWSQQRWGKDAVITLSPSANKIQFRRADSMVDSLVNHYNGKSVMNQSFENLTTDKYRTTREDGEFEIMPDPTVGGIYFANIKTVQYEHTLVLNNTTIFNDIIYQPELGNRQNRLKLVGWRTGNWDGSLTAQGFVLNQGKVDSWIQNTDYSKGAIIKYNNKLYTASESHTSGLLFEFEKWSPTDNFKLGLLPNWDTLGGNFESFFDVDTVNLEGDAEKFGKSLIGYQPRKYLENLGLDDSSQVKFYQGMIKEKGTSNAIDKLLRARLDNTTTDIDMYEEWAIRVGEYGGLDINQRLEIELKDSDTTGNPTVLHTIDSIEDEQEGVKNVLIKNMYKAPPGLQKNWIPENKTTGLTGDVLPNVGYAKLTDADATLFNISSYSNLDSNVNNMQIGYHLYVANDENLDWNFYYLDITKEIVTKAQASDKNTILWETKTQHNLVADDLIVIKGMGAANGVHKVLRSTGLKSFETNEQSDGLDVTGEASVLKFNSIRYKDSAELLGFNPINGWKKDDKLFLDDVANAGWKVYQKTNEYTVNKTHIPSNYAFNNGELGTAFKVNANKSLGIFGSPNVNSYGSLFAYIPDNKGVLGEVARINAPNDNRFSGFGHSVDIKGVRFVVGSKSATDAPEGILFVYFQAGNVYSPSFAWAPETITGTSKLNVKFSKDGSKIIAGAPGTNKAYIFERENDTDIFTVTDTFTGDNTTTAFTASADIGAKIVTVDGIIQVLNEDYTVSTDTITFNVAPATSTSIKVKSGQNWSLKATISGPASSEFGSSIDMDQSGDNVIIGAPALNTSFNNEGAAYVYSKLTSTSYIETQKILSTLTNAEARFGESVACNSDMSKLFVGAPGVNRFQRASGLVQKLSLGSLGTNVHEGPTFTALATGTISINGISVTVAGQNLEAIKDTINNKNIANITASVTDDKLSIAYSDLIRKLIIVDTSGNLFANVIGDQWTNKQNIVQNALTDGQEFGRQIAINTTGTTMAVGAPTSIYNDPLTYDTDTTKFDSNSTLFIDQTDRGGNVYVYQEIDNKFTQVQKIKNDNIDSDDQFGRELQVLDTNDIYVGMPFDDKTGLTNSGAVIHYKANGNVFTIHEEQSKLIDITKINRVFSYDKVRNEVINYYDWIDPIKGKIPGQADENIDFKTLWDPATYSLENSATWGPDQVGKIWWDLSKVKYNFSEQGDWAYRSSFWGSVFPGSSVDIYQWIESDKLPSAYEGSGTVYNSIFYTTVTEKVGTAVKNRYFYWVRNVLDIDSTKTYSAKDVQDILVDPTAFGLKYVGFTSNTDIALFNFNSDLRESGTILVVDYDKTKNNKIIHNEWVLLKENVADETLPENFKRKLIDSLVGADSFGNTVPDNTLSVSEQYGIQFRPRQSLFIKRFEALKVFLQTVNTIMSKNTIALTKNITPLLDKDPEPKQASGDWDQKVANNNELGYVRIAEKPLGYKVLVSVDSTVQNRWSIYVKTTGNKWTLDKLQGYDVTTQWSYADWYATGFSATTYINHSIALKKDLVNITPATGETVKVENGGDWELLYWNGTSYTTVGIKNATIQISEGVWNYTSTRYGYDSEVFDFQLFDQEPQIETRKIVETILNNILIDDLALQANNTIFTMLYYILDEQPFVDWLFKTSFIGVNHKIRALDALPYYRKDNQTYVSDFISEAKPYRTKIREYILNYDKTDPYDGDNTDFDLHSVYDEALGYYRKPDGTRVDDDGLMKTGFNKPWNDNKAFEIGTINIINGGTDYNFVPTVSITGGGGSGASATAIVESGIVTGVTVDKKGTGYTSTPNVSIATSTGTNATAYVQLENNKIRTLDTTLKFDRINFTSEVKEWLPNTSYSTDDKITYQGEAYKAFEDFTSGTTFTSDSMNIILDESFLNAMDRTIAYYQPTDTQPAKQLENLFYGIEYPGNKVTGPGFELEPGMDRAGFDVTPFDNFEIGEEGTPMISGIVDTIINSRFGDTLLGTRATDINVDGAKFVDANNSHAPEEFVPGRVFDSLDMEIYQTPSSLYGGSGLSPRVDIIKHTGDGQTKKFKFQTGDGKHNMNLLLYTQQTGKVQPDEFTIDYSTFEVEFTTAPVSGDVIDIVSVGNTGENMVLDYVISSDGVDAKYTLPVSSSVAQQALVIVDGVKKDHQINDVNGRAELEFTGGYIPSAGAHIHIFAFNLDPSTRIAYSHIGQERFTMDGSTRTFTLANQPLYDGPVDAKVYVELAEERIRPAVYSYHTGDGTETNFAITEAADVDHATLTTADVSVFIDGVASSSWTLVTSGSTKQVQFTTAPSSGAKIVLGDNTNADYTIVGSTLTLDSSLTITNGLSLNVTTFSSHNVLEMTTETFKGSTATPITLASGFDSTAFDSINFDVPSTQIVNTPTYTLYETPANINYLWVTKNGIRLSPGSDFVIENNQLKITSAIGTTDFVIVSHFSERSLKHRISWKVWHDILGSVRYYRMSQDNTTTLAEDLSKDDKEITVVDGSKLATPSLNSNKAGVVWIGGERIVYWQLDGNKLKNIRRGTMGTARAYKHYKTNQVIDISDRQEILDGHSKVWYTYGDAQSLQRQTTQQAKFLNENVGTNPLVAVVNDQSGRYIASGYVDENYVQINE